MFQFKLFTILQDQCAMKVCTDSCILGAYIIPNKAQNILDIGTGTGLLSLMLAQKTKSQITAIEIDENAFKQAKITFENSNWSNQINLIHVDINEFTKKSDSKYDLIICNPPFYVNSLKANNDKTNLAYHSTSLTQEELLESVLNLLDKSGQFTLLLPVQEALQFQEKAFLKKLYLKSSLIVSHNSNKKPFRRVDTYSFENSTTEQNTLIIRNSDNSYTNEFIQLLKPYYLNL